MAAFSILNFTITVLLVFLSRTSSTPLPYAPKFDPNLLLIGDARLTNSASSVQLTDPTSSSSSGLLIRSKTFKFRSSNSKKPAIKPVSFSTDFIFSISPHDGDGLALIIVPADFSSNFSRDGFGLSRQSRFFAVEFDTSRNENVGDENANHVGIDVASLHSVQVSNVSSIGLVLNSGIKLHSWVDYDSSSKRLEVRLSGFGSPRPYAPLLAYQIDLGEMWKGEEVLVGLSSSRGNSVQKTCIYSWKFAVRIAPKWLHSQPVNPQAFSSKRSEDKVADKKSLCALRLLSGLIFATGCGLLAAFVVLFLWAVFANNDQVAVIPVKCSANAGDFRYEKIQVVLEDSSDAVKN
ncbi:L-type lectin-domain containing receptor kinase VIII.1-like [Coffea arabica]|uniref:L-type lectin-domain containing receptor kinase VIII.1-like n=1 Tax=Coffea arabica TaxID=13443 RepID=A0ABM4WBQ9_COFAR|nr:L-type lectin-domain containing receptor kinase VIII.1-like [Coffea arabica]